MSHIPEGGGLGIQIRLVVASACSVSDQRYGGDRETRGVSGNGERETPREPLDRLVRGGKRGRRTGSDRQELVTRWWRWYITRCDARLWVV
ncbi:hypothetical protein FA13DRAFT_836962 [Coprinellus micaceus]|uniref:Uncharacterized protein n=1 Tax=Coprinellus micaceus TaxID=71717 RepID=A0A4Y7S285_COPMI|nr:hypothetical protein FA13DRAFT_836962 [Coprinellus micaceus]